MKEFTGEKDFIPFRYQGHYEDEEIGLYYNRFRYYDPEQGNYTQIDPIGLAGNNPTLYGYVSDPNIWVDPFGLAKTIVPVDLFVFGNKTQPRPPRSGKDIKVDENGMLKSQANKMLPEGASAFDDVNKAPLQGHYHVIPKGTELPEGLGVIADGKDVPGYEKTGHGRGHHTIFPTKDMSYDDFVEKYNSIQSSYGGKKCPS